MFQSFPVLVTALKDDDSEHSVRALQGIIEALRNFRGENSIPPKAELTVHYQAASPAAEAFVRLHAPEILTLARLGKLVAINQGDMSADGAVVEAPHGSQAVVVVTNPPIEFRIDLTGLVNVDEEMKRLSKEIEKVADDLAHVNRKLGQDTFLAKAPPELVAKERRKADELQAKLGDLQKSLDRFRAQGAKR